MARQQLRERLDIGLPRDGTVSRITTSRVVRSVSIEIGSISVATKRRSLRLSRTCRAPAASRRRRSAWPNLPNISGNTTTSTPPAMSSSMKTAMRSPFLVFSAAGRVTMPPTQTSASDCVSSRERCAPNAFSSLGEALERMAAHVEAERFLLERERLRLGPRRDVGQRTASSASRRLRRAAEELRLALVAIALVPAAVVDAPGRRPAKQPRAPGQIVVRPPGRRGVERAGLDQALEDLLVDQPQVDLLAQARRATSMRPPAALRDSSIDWIAPSPAPFTAPRPNRTPSGSTVNCELARVDVRRQHGHAELAALAEIERELVGVLPTSIVSSAAMKCRG